MAASKKRSASGSKRSSRKPRRTWAVYVHRLLKGVHKDVTISAKSMAIINSFINDVFENIAVEAGSVARITKSRTLSSHDVQAAVRLVFGGELGKHATAEGTKAIAKVSKH